MADPTIRMGDQLILGSEDRGIILREPAKDFGRELSVSL